MDSNHRNVIVTWIDGEEVEYKLLVNGKSEWCNVENPEFLQVSEYRVKPDTIRFRLYLYKGAETTRIGCYYEYDSYNPEEMEGFIRWINI